MVFQFVEMVLLKKENNVIAERQRCDIVMVMLLQNLDGVREYPFCFDLIVLMPARFFSLQNSFNILLDNQFYVIKFVQYVPPTQEFLPLVI